MMKKFILAVILFAISVTVHAANEMETWECKDPNGKWNDILVTAIANKTTGDGTIKVAGIEHSTKFKIAGFDRQWQFGKESSTGIFQYVFRVKPNGIAHYFNMPSTIKGESVESEMVLMCRIKGPGWSAHVPHNYEEEKSNIDKEQSPRPCLPGFFIMNFDE